MLCVLQTRCRLCYLHCKKKVLSHAMCTVDKEKAVLCTLSTQCKSYCMHCTGVCHVMCSVNRWEPCCVHCKREVGHSKCTVKEEYVGIIDKGSAMFHGEKVISWCTLYIEGFRPEWSISAFCTFEKNGFESLELWWVFPVNSSYLNFIQTASSTSSLISEGGICTIASLY